MVLDCFLDRVGGGLEGSGKGTKLLIPLPVLSREYQPIKELNVGNL